MLISTQSRVVRAARSNLQHARVNLDRMNLADFNNDRAAVGPEPMEVEDDSQAPDYVRGRQILPSGALKLSHNISNYIGSGAARNSKL
mgnify:CR=1 FL=1